MKNIKSKVLYKDNNLSFYYCDCCEKFYLKYNELTWKLSPLRFSEFYELINTINEFYYTSLEKINKINYSIEIGSLFRLEETEIEKIVDMFDSIIIDIKRIIFEINFLKVEVV
ncbi:MAG: DUF6686 family protein [Candidatus Sericytochromatia bacterium]